MYFIIFYLLFVPAGVQLEGEIYRLLLRDLQSKGEILAHNLEEQIPINQISLISLYLLRHSQVVQLDTPWLGRRACGAESNPSV